MAVRAPKHTQAAGLLKSFFAKAGISITHTQALEAVAITQGFASFQTMSANSANSPESSWLRPLAADRFEADIPKDQAIWIHFKNATLALANRGTEMNASFLARDAERNHTFSEANVSFEDLDSYLKDNRSINKAVFFSEDGYRDRGKGWYWVYPSLRMLESWGDTAVRRYHYNGPFSNYEEAETQRLTVAGSKACDQVASAIKNYQGDEPLAKMSYRFEYIFSCGSPTLRDHAIKGLINEGYFKDEQEAGKFLDKPVSIKDNSSILIMLMALLRPEFSKNTELATFVMSEYGNSQPNALSVVKERLGLKDSEVEVPLIF